MNQPEEQYKSIHKLDLKEVQPSFPKAFKQIHCPSCEEETPAENLYLQNSMAKCSSCNAIFSIHADVESVQSQQEIKQETLRPEGIDLFYFGGELDISIRQHLHMVYILGLIFLPLFALIFILLFIKGKILIFAPLFLTLSSAYLIYKAATVSKDKTHISINNKFMSIVSRPRNFHKDRMYDVHEIDQIYIKKSTEMPNYFTLFMQVNGVHGQKHEKIVTVNSLSKAKYLEQEIEKYLEIEDRKVPEADV